MIRLLAAGLVLALPLFLGAGAMAQELRVGLQAEPVTLDPYFRDRRAEQQIAAHIFEPLLARDASQRLLPALAVSWRPLDDLTWEFKLRGGVKFHDGSGFSAEDVAFSFERLAKVPGGAPFAARTRIIRELRVVDPLTLQIVTAQPAPLLPGDLADIPIMSKKAASGPAAEGRTTAQLNGGDGLVGTGPYKFVEWLHGDRLVLAANTAWWRDRPKWQRVVFRPLPDDAARVAALLAGGIDLIEMPPPAELPKLRQDARVVVTQGLSTRLVHVALDQGAETLPGGQDGRIRNPLRDRRVRQALSLAIDRDELVGRILQGLGVVAGDLQPPPQFGSRQDAKAEKFDADGARRLLAQAGYPEGFPLTLAAPEGRFLADAEIARRIAAAWARIGVKTKILPIARDAALPNPEDGSYGALLSGWDVGGEPGGAVKALLASPDRDRGRGIANRGRYANPALDAKLDEALRATDDARREALMQDASRLALADYALLPLYFEVAAWVTRRNLSYLPRLDQRTLAENAVLAP